MPAGASSERKPGAEQPAIGAGLIVLVVGPSGAGKDAVIGEVRRRLAGDRRFVFPRRLVTREANPAEDHASLSAAEFEAGLRIAAFALHWQAHGLHYAIPAEVDAAVRAGACVIFNASRSCVPVAKARYASVGVVLVEAPLEVRTRRLAARDREAPAEIVARLERIVPDFTPADASLVIDNAGELASAADALVAWLVGRQA